MQWGINEAPGRRVGEDWRVVNSTAEGREMSAALAYPCEGGTGEYGEGLGGGGRVETREGR